ncbi:hypothetical protein E1B28_007899 [Marasmius oreades]|uniref:Uncharacterized protein n=1 Tax=Marasmius oreades TaxID=181124 RepID=A0A9P7S352_9AGAR|nr:uncharacterized protein E1B28_007899 [Marasmius oreades]KAG7094298.1 hypothetical protein E1B28_007899 [Marasmius oreades]
MSSQDTTNINNNPNDTDPAVNATVDVANDSAAPDWDQLGAVISEITVQRLQSIVETVLETVLRDKITASSGSSSSSAENVPPHVECTNSPAII